MSDQEVIAEMETNDFSFYPSLMRKRGALMLCTGWMQAVMGYLYLH